MAASKCARISMDCISLTLRMRIILPITGQHRKFSDTPKRILTMQNIIDMGAALIGRAPGFDPEASASQIKKLRSSWATLPEKQEDLPVIPMKDTFAEVCIPLSDPVLRIKYVNKTGDIRYGRLLEDLDAFAGFLAYKFIKIPGYDILKGQLPPLFIATASADNIGLMQRFRNDFVNNSTRGLTTADAPNVFNDIKLSGFTSWTGKSSMELSMSLQQLRDKSWVELITARFVMVARNALGKGKAVINRVQCETEEEQEIFKAGGERHTRRLEDRNRSLLKTPPNDYERQLVHDLFLSMTEPNSQTFMLKTEIPGHVWMSDCNMSSTIVCFPEQRNMHDKLFGGYIMRQCMELAYSTAIVHCRMIPQFHHIDDVYFIKPVDIGSLLLLSSKVIYTQGPYAVIRVECLVQKNAEDTAKTATIYRITYMNKDKQPVPPVLPRTYSEAMFYIEGLRCFRRGEEEMEAVLSQQRDSPFQE